MNLRLDGTPVARLTRRLYDEFEQAPASVSARPFIFPTNGAAPIACRSSACRSIWPTRSLRAWKTSSWKASKRRRDDEIMRFLRHEAGHAFNYAYRLYDTPEWTAIFGPFLRPYTDDYTPKTFSRSFVRHLPAWYAQKHPDEDFAETFAVWLDPQSNWREVYADWGCLRKLKYVDELAHRIGHQPPPVTADNYDTQEEYLATRSPSITSRTTPRRRRDSALVRHGPARHLSALARRAKHRKAGRRFPAKAPSPIVRTVFYWTGLNYDLVRGAGHSSRRTLLGAEPQVGSRPVGQTHRNCRAHHDAGMNRLHTGEFVQK